MINFSEIVRGLNDTDLLNFVNSVKVSYPEGFTKGDDTEAAKDPEVEKLERLIDSVPDKAPLKQELKVKLGVKLSHKNKYNYVFFSNGWYQAKIYDLTGALIATGNQYKDKERAAYEAGVLVERYKKMITKTHKSYIKKQKEEKLKTHKSNDTLRKERIKEEIENTITFEENDYGVKGVYKGLWNIDFTKTKPPKGYKPDLTDNRITAGYNGAIHKIDFYHNGVRQYTKVGTSSKKSKVYYALEFIDKYLRENESPSI